MPTSPPAWPTTDPYTVAIPTPPPWSATSEPFVARERVIVSHFGAPRAIDVLDADDEPTPGQAHLLRDDLLEPDGTMTHEGTIALHMPEEAHLDPIQARALAAILLELAGTIDARG